MADPAGMPMKAGFGYADGGVGYGGWGGRGLGITGIIGIMRLRV